MSRDPDAGPSGPFTVACRRAALRGLATGLACGAPLAALGAPAGFVAPAAVALATAAAAASAVTLAADLDRPRLVARALVAWPAAACALAAGFVQLAIADGFDPPALPGVLAGAAFVGLVLATPLAAAAWHLLDDAVHRRLWYASDGTRPHPEPWATEALWFGTVLVACSIVGLLLVIPCLLVAGLWRACDALDRRLVPRDAERRPPPPRSAWQRALDLVERP